MEKSFYKDAIQLHEHYLSSSDNRTQISFEATFDFLCQTYPDIRPNHDRKNNLLVLPGSVDISTGIYNRGNVYDYSVAHFNSGILMNNLSSNFISSFLHQDQLNKISLDDKSGKIRALHLNFCDLEEKDAFFTIFVVLSSIEDEEKIQTTIESQLRLLLLLIDTLEFDPKCHLVEVQFILSPKNKFKKQHLEQRLKNIAENIQKNWNFVSFSLASGAFQGACRRLIHKTFSPLGDEKQKLLKQIGACIVLTCPKYFLSRVTETENLVQILYGEFLDLRNPKEVTDSVMGNYFPEFEMALEVLPDFNYSNLNLVCLAGPNGALSSQSDEIRKYLGEIRYFYSELLPSLEKASGVLLHSFKRENVRNIFSESINVDFERDWLWCTAGNILGIEVSVSERPDNPISTIINKIQQISEGAGPNILHIVRSLWMHWKIETSGKQDYETALMEAETFMNKYIKFIVFIPNTSLEVVTRAVNPADDKETKRKQLFREVLQNCSESILKRTYFIIPENDKHVPGSRKYGLYRATEDGFQKCSETLECLLSETREYKDDVEERNIRYAKRYITSMLCINYLLNKLKIGSTEKDDSSKYLSISQRVSRSWLPKNRPDLTLNSEMLNSNVDFVKLDILPTLQQVKIIDKKERFFSLHGEPGSGKTTILMIVALQESLNPNVSRIYFAVRRDKHLLRTQIDTLVKMSESRLLESKLEFIDDIEEFRFECLQDEAKIQALHKTVLLIDELYMKNIEENHSPIHTLQKFSDDFLPHFHRVCMCTIRVSQKRPPGQKMSYNSCVVEGFISESLNVLLRSTSYISATASKILNRTQLPSRTTARLSQCFVTQEDRKSLEPVYFTSPEDIGKTIRDTLQQNLCIVITANPGRWTKFFELGRVVICSWNEDQDPNFSGCEFDSVFLVIENLETHHFTDSTAISTFVLAMTRAKFSLKYFVQEDSRESFHRMIYGKRPELEDLLVKARNGESNIDLGPIEKLAGTEEVNLRKQLNNLVRAAILTQNISLIKRVVNKFGSDSVDFLALVMGLHGDLDDSFLAQLGSLEVFGNLLINTLKASEPNDFKYDSNGLEVDVVQIAGAALRRRFVKVIKWAFGLMDHQTLTKFLDLSKDILYNACFSGETETLQVIVDILRKHDHRLLFCYMNAIYQTYNADDNEKEKLTLLTMLCKNNSKAENVQILLRNGFENFDNPAKFRGRNALHYCIWYGNEDLTSAVLGSSKSALYYLVTVGDDYNGMSAPEYAQSLENLPIANLIDEKYKKLYFL